MRPGETLVGMAYSPAVLAFARAHPDALDYVEVPFEQLRHDPGVAALQEEFPVVLHCASLSMAGFVPPSDAVVDAVAAETARTGTPWVGEHLAFLSAEPLGAPPGRGDPTQLTYTVAPQYSEEVLEQVVANLDRLAPRVPAPLILENSPQYLSLPGSTMTMVEFVGGLAAARDLGLLLDLSHFAITAHNMRYDLDEAFDAYPLEQVVEVHLSGHSVRSGIMWDDHALPAPEGSFRLLQRLLERCRPQAVTLEYNWSPDFPADLVRCHLDRARTLVGRA